MLEEQGLKSSDLRTNPRQRCSKPLIEAVVRSVELGERREVVCEHYGISMPSLVSWMRLYGSEDYQRNKMRPFTSQQKSSILRRIEQGSMTIQQAMSVYNIKGRNTIKKWQQQYRQEDTALIATNPSIMEQLPTSPEGSSDPKSLELEKALAEAKLKIAALETMIDLAEQQFKIKIRKKSGAKQSPK